MTRFESCVQALLEVINQPSTPRGAAAAAADAGSPLKISLFSLGNMCAHKSCADALLQLGITDSLSRLSRVPDATVKKYIERIQVRRISFCEQSTSCVMTQCSAVCIPPSTDCVPDAGQVARSSASQTDMI